MRSRETSPEEREPRLVTRRQFLGAVAAATGAAACSSLPPAKPPTTIPLIYDDKGGLLVEARVNGREIVRLLFDTGASRSTLSSDYARMLGLAVRAGDPVEGSAGVVESGSAVADVEIPGAGTERVDVAVYVFGSYDPQCVGILGYEWLRRAPFRIRYRDYALEWNARAPAKTIPMTLDGKIPRIGARVNGKPVDLRVDSGAAFPPGDDAYLNVTELQAAQLGLAGKPVTTFTATGTGSEVLKLPVHKLASLEIAGVERPRAFAIVQPRVGYFARADAVGFVGNSVLDKLDPYFDYAAGAFGIGAGAGA